MSSKGKKNNWLRKHLRDPYVQQAFQAGWRSRAVFKLEEIQKKDRVFKPGLRVVDLGAAPGGWSQYAMDCMKGDGQVIAMDLLPIDPIGGVTFIQGDFREEAVYDQLMAALEGQPVDVVMSDMAPNMSGHVAVDQPRAMYLTELAVEFAGQVLSDNGRFIVKLFQGEGIDALIKQLRQDYRKVVIRKPKASRDASREFYLVATGLLR